MAQVVECLLSKRKALGINACTTKGGKECWTEKSN
jgi:hypothetical protein